MPGAAGDVESPRNRLAKPQKVPDLLYNQRVEVGTASEVSLRRVSRLEVVQRTFLRSTIAYDFLAKQPVVLAVRQVSGGLGDAVVVVVDAGGGNDVVDVVKGEA